VQHVTRWRYALRNLVMEYAWEDEDPDTHTCLWVTIDDVRQEDPQACCDRYQAEARAVSEALAAVRAAIPDSMCKAVLDSDGDPVMLPHPDFPDDRSKRSPARMVKDKHQPVARLADDGKITIVVPGADAKLIKALNVMLGGKATAATDELP
jgi:hypothetical protein